MARPHRPKEGRGAMNEAEAWIQEARRRHRVALHLHEQGYASDSVSRAYYALVAAIQGLLLTVGSRPTSHAGLKNQLGLHFVKPNRLPSDASNIFEELRQRRNEVDYEMRPVSSEQARHLLTETERIIGAIEALI